MATNEAVADCDSGRGSGSSKRMDLKQEICSKQLQVRSASRIAILATNTSSLSITGDLQRLWSRAVVGMHFFNPAPVMKLVEVIAGMRQPSPETVQSASKRSLWQIGKTPVQVNEAAGFVVNRILIPMINEAVGIYADGVAPAQRTSTPR